MDCPFIVCMTYAFHTQDKLCFILDLMNGGDLHYHLSQHGVFSEDQMKFYAAEVIIHTIDILQLIFLVTISPTIFKWKLDLSALFVSNA